MDDTAIRKKKQNERQAKCRQKIKENDPAKHELTKLKSRENAFLWHAKKIRNMTEEQIAVYRQSREAAARKNRFVLHLI